MFTTKTNDAIAETRTDSVPWFALHFAEFLAPYMMTLPRLSIFIGCLLLVCTAHAQDRLLSPSEFLGYELGNRFTPHHRVMDYVAHVATTSPNIQTVTYGETYEGRPLKVAYIANPSNLGLGVGIGFRL